MPRLLLLAGPNGAGKTTLARRLFAAEIAAGWFLNADEIAHSLRPDSVDEASLEAGREVLLRRRALIAGRQDFNAEAEPRLIAEIRQGQVQPLEAGPWEDLQASIARSQLFAGRL